MTFTVKAPADELPRLRRVAVVHRVTIMSETPLPGTRNRGMVQVTLEGTPDDYRKMIFTPYTGPNGVK